MKTVVTIAAGLAALVLALLVLLGGVVHYRFSRYLADTPPSFGGFRLLIGPQFSKGGDHRTVVPRLYHRIVEGDQAPKVFVDLTDNTLVCEYGDKASITLTTVEVTNEFGHAFSLIPVGAPQTFPVDHSGYGNRRAELGPVAGERLTLTAEGYTIDKQGAKAPFRQTMHWRVHRSTRTTLALLAAE